MRDIARPNGDQRGWNWANSTTAPGAGTIIYANNPFWIRERNFQEDDTQRIFGNINLAYDLTSNLTASVFGRLDYYNQRRQDCNDCHHHKQLNERKPFSHPCPLLIGRGYVSQSDRHINAPSLFAVYLCGIALC